MVSQRQGTDSSFAHFDGVKNLRMLTDDTGMVTDEYDFDAFGSELSTSGSTLNAHRWKGESLAYYREPDAAPSLQYALHFRNYDPLTGTFPSRDPAEDDSNLYRYVKNNPLNASDPSGLAELDPKNVPRSFIDKLVENGAEWRHHLRSADDKHSSVSFRYVDPETGDERVAIFRSRDTTSYLIWTETRWELMGTAPLKGMSYEQAFDTIHDSPIEAMAANDAVAFMQAIPLVRTADSISQGKVSESGLNLASDVTDTLSLGGTAAGSNALKWAGRSILAGQVGLGTYEATQQGDTSRLKGAMVDLAVQSITGTKSTKTSTNGKLSTSGNEVAVGEASAQGLAPKWTPHPGFQMPAADKGRFLGDIGNSPFKLTDEAADALGLSRGSTIPWQQGIPNFAAHAVPGPGGLPSSFDVPGLTGNHAADRTLMLQHMSANTGMTQREIQRWLSTNNVRLHHSGGDAVQIVPANVHSLHHSGGAQQLRGN